MKKDTGLKVLKKDVCLPTRQIQYGYQDYDLLIYLNPVQPRMGEWFSHPLHYQIAWDLYWGNAVGADFH